jgi:uncharacterized protein YggE
MFRSLGQIIVTALIIGLVLIAGGIGWFLRSSVEDSGGQATSEAAQGTEMSAEMAKATLGSGAALEPFIAVTGVGQAQAKPDIASVSLGVQTQAPVARDAQTENSELMAKVIDAIKAMGIEDEDISTHGLSLRPRYDREGQKVVAYLATNNVSVIVRDLDQVGEVLDAGFDAGANVAGGVQFSIADPTDSRNQAMELAVADARDRADVLAKAAGVTIVGVLSVTEDSGGYSSPRATNVMAFAESAAMKLATPIEPGELTIGVRVRVVYSIGS